MWTITENLSITFYMDGMARFFSCLIASVWALVAFYAFEYIQHEGAEERFCGFYTMTLGILIGLSYSGNLMTLYMLYEMMTLITVPLVIHSRTREAIMAGLKYLGYSTFGAGMGLFGFFFPLALQHGHYLYHPAVCWTWAWWQAMKTPFWWYTS